MGKSIIGLFLVLVILACKEEKKKQVGAIASPQKEIWDNQWTSLMNKNQWRGYNQDSLPTNWAIHDSIIECFGKAGDLGGDIISKDQYDNFELRLQWKISPEGNSGIFYHVVEDTIYHSPYETGPEYQILDDVGFPQPLEDWQKTGANYAMHAANDQKKLMPVGDWNTTRIIFNNGKVEHWLNGKKIVMFDKYADDWTTKRNEGKWKDYPDYGNTNSGYLGLQDHGAGVWFKNIRIRPL
ncbi:MAG: DUF1080 domain-containing protein [Bacteroidota bacterium]